MVKHITFSSSCCLPALTLLLLLLLAPNLASAGSSARCDQGEFTASLRSGADLVLNLPPGDIDIVGGDREYLSVECEIRERTPETKPMMARFSANGKGGLLTIDGGPNLGMGVRIRIVVPKRSNLVARASAGDVDVTGVEGHKDFSLRAGDLRIDVGNPQDYMSARAWVTAGDLHASAFGVEKGGLFRSFSHNNRSGKYRLKASLWAGDLTLRRSR